MDIFKPMKIDTRLISLLVVVSVLTCGCSRRPKPVPYENLGTGEGNPKAALILAAAKAVFANVKAEDWSALHKKMTPYAGNKIPEGQLAAQCEMMCKRFGVPADIEILEIHLGEFPERPTNVHPTALIGIEGRSQVLPNPIRIASPVTGQVAIVLSSCAARKSGMKSWLTIVLHGVKSGWGMVNLHANNYEVNGHDGNWYLSKAREFTRNRMQRNAFLYRQFGTQLLIPGPYIVSRSVSDQLQRLVKTEPPPNMPFPGVRPSETWRTDDGEEFVVEFVSIASGPSFLSLEIRYKSDGEDPDSTKAKARSQRLFQHIRERFPEYQEGFDSILIGSLNSVGTGFREFFPFDEKNGDSAHKSIDSDKQ